MKAVSTFFLILVAAFCNAQNWEFLNQKYEQFRNTGKIDSALFYAEKAEKQAEKEFGTQHKNYLTSLSNLGSVYQKSGNYKAAEKVFLKSKELRLSVYGEKHANYANALNSLGGLYVDMGRYDDAEPLYKQALDIYYLSVGEKHQNYANTLFNLGRLYYYKGNYAQAEPCYLKAISISKELKTENTRNYAQFINDVAVLYRKMGNEEKAVENYEKAIAILKEIKAVNSPDYLRILNNLASIYNDRNEYEKAEKLYLEIHDLQKKILGNSHPDYLITLNNIACLYNNMEKYDKAAPFLEEAISLGQQTVGTGHPHYAATLNYQANLYLSRKEWSKAEKNFLECLSLREKLFGPNHPLTSKTLYDIAILYFATNRIEESEVYFKKMIESRLYQVRNNFQYLSEDEKERYWRTIKKELDAFYTFAVYHYHEHSNIATYLYDFHLATKGILFSSGMQMRNAVVGSNNPELIRKFDEWVKMKNIIGQLNMLNPEEALLVKINKDSLITACNLLEKEISKISDLLASSQKKQEISWKDLQKELKNDEAIIEYIDYNRYSDFHFSDTTYIIAMVIKKDMAEPLIIPLCTENVLYPAMENTLSNAVVSDYVLDVNKAKLLYSHIWKPLEKSLNNVQKVYISLSGILNRISFSILVDENNKLLIDKHELCFLNSTKNLFRSSKNENINVQSMALYGKIRYDEDFGTMIEKAAPYYENFDRKMLQIDSVGKTNIDKWDFLPGTEVELENIKKIAVQKNWNHKCFKENDANEESFKSITRANSPTILHLATHGFFFSDAGSSELVRNVFEANKNPLFRSGIVLAGGNNAWLEKRVSGIEDGILTAYEVSNCNLFNTELVVLSACETGLGDIRSGEGVYGLQRAFQIAGARAVIMSLWDVPDKETVELMTLFYQNLAQTHNIRASFRMAQQELKKKYEPFYWAAFVLME